MVCLRAGGLERGIRGAGHFKCSFLSVESSTVELQAKGISVKDACLRVQ